MSKGKVVTAQTLIGEAGIALIHRRVTEMGFLFHPRRVDHGIDGHIDLVDARTHEVQNLVLLVQSKASNRPFAYEDDDGFTYSCDEQDLNYWLSGNAPVILVLSHPEQDEAWWVDVKAELADPKARAARVVKVDKHRQRFDASAAQPMATRAVPKDSGLFLAPPPKPETLTSNLLKVASLPPVLYVAPASVTTYRAAGELLAREHRTDRSDWILRDRLVMSFSDLVQSPLSVLSSGDVERHDTAEWSQSEDMDVIHAFAHLLSRAVGGDCRGDLRWHKEREHLHFRPSKDLTPRKEGRAFGRAGRTVFKAHYSKSDPEKVSFYRHAALQARFRAIDGQWYWQLTPDYCFTRDGYEESPYADSLLSGIKRLDRHSAVAGWTQMWSTYLQRQPTLFEDRLILFGGLATFDVDRGIDDRLWGPAPPSSADGETVSTVEQAKADADLAAAGVGTEDLMAMLADSEADQPGPATADGRNHPDAMQAKPHKPGPRLRRKQGK